MLSVCYFCLILTKTGVFQQIVVKKSSMSNVSKICTVGAKFYVDRQKDRRGRTSICYLICELAKKCNFFVCFCLFPTTDLIANTQTYEVNSVLLRICALGLIVKLICRVAAEVSCDLNPHSLSLLNNMNKFNFLNFSDISFLKFYPLCIMN
jgi:hypothetical protein